jgi:hypothetical protein
MTAAQVILTDEENQSLQSLSQIVPVHSLKSRSFRFLGFEVIELDGCPQSETGRFERSAVG